MFVIFDEDLAAASNRCKTKLPGFHRVKIGAAVGVLRGGSCFSSVTAEEWLVAKGGWVDGLGRPLESDLGG